MSARVRVEIAVASVDDAIAAEGGGAARVELNAALELGGLTPSAGMIEQVRRACSLPVVMMVRPRPGGFCYSGAEFTVMRRDIDAAFDAGIDAIAFGVLTAQGQIDRARCQEIVRQASPNRLVFHRAFDFTPDPFLALDELSDLGIARVMTSGQQETALEGAALIAQLVRRSAGRIEILPAGRIRPHNLAALVAATGCQQVHAAPREFKIDASLQLRPALPLSSATNSNAHGVITAAAVAELVTVAESLASDVR